MVVTQYLVHLLQSVVAVVVAELVLGKRVQMVVLVGAVVTVMAMVELELMVKEVLAV